MGGTTDAGKSRYECLQGYVVLDFTHYLSGPLCTKVLAALGATIIKVEPPVGGDGNRLQPPFVTESGLVSQRQDDSLMGLAFLKRNAGKKSIAVDLKTPEGRQIIRRLVGKADVLVHNFRTAVPGRLGLDEASVRKINPRIVYCEIAGYGPYAEVGSDEGAVDNLVQALSGIMGHTGHADGPPTRCAAPIADESAGLFATISILAGLLQRDSPRGNGRASGFSVSLLGSLASLFWDEHHDVYANAGASPRNGNTTPRMAPFNAYCASDGKYVALSAVSEREWRSLVDAIGSDALQRPEWNELQFRLHDKPYIDSQIEQWMCRRTRAQACAELRALGVSVVPVNTVEDLLADSRMVSTMLCNVNDPNVGATTAFEARFPIIENGRQLAGFEDPAPLLGDDTVDVLTNVAGMQGAEIAELAARGVIRDAGWKPAGSGKGPSDSPDPGRSTMERDRHA